MTDPNRILDRYLDGELPAQDLENIEHALASDPSFADGFAGAMLMETFLREKFEREELIAAMQLGDGSFIGDQDLRLLMDDYEHAEAGVVDVNARDRLDLDAKQDDSGSISTRELASVGGYLLGKALVSKPGITASVAAVLVLAMTLFVVFSGNTDEPGQVAVDRPDVAAPAVEPVAMLTDIHEARWRVPHGQIVPSVGDVLVQGQTLTLVAGTAEITTNHGAITRVQAPAVIELIADNAVYLHEGRLVGMCYTETSKGFVVRTDHATIVDLGTEFGVHATATNITATVFTGEVELTPPGGTPQPITANQTARLTVDGNNRGLVVEDVLVDGFEQMVPRLALMQSLRSDPAMIAYYGFEAVELDEGVVLNTADATRGRMDGVMGQADRPDSSPTPTEGRWPGTGALRFEAEQFDIVRVPAEDAALLNGLEQFTIGLWVRPDHMDQVSHHLVTKRARTGLDSLNFGMSWELQPAAGFQRNAVFFHGVTPGPDRQGVSSDADTLLRESRWMHLVVTYDRGERSIYLDGQLIQRLTSSDAGRVADLDAELLIGAAAPHLGQSITYLDGDLDELFILGRVMSPDEITALYKTGVAQP